MLKDNTQNVDEIPCTYCNHYASIRGEKPVCKAFPSGIPRDILHGFFIHTKPYVNEDGVRLDKGFTYEPISKVLDYNRIVGNN